MSICGGRDLRDRCEMYLIDAGIIIFVSIAPTKSYSALRRPCERAISFVPSFLRSFFSLHSPVSAAYRSRGVSSRRGFWPRRTTGTFALGKRGGLYTESENYENEVGGYRIIASGRTSRPTSIRRCCNCSIVNWTHHCGPRWSTVNGRPRPRAPFTHKEISCIKCFFINYPQNRSRRLLCEGEGPRRSVRAASAKDVRTSCEVRANKHGLLTSVKSLPFAIVCLSSCKLRRRSALALNLPFRATITSD